MSDDNLFDDEEDKTKKTTKAADEAEAGSTDEGADGGADGDSDNGSAGSAVDDSSDGSASPDGDASDDLAPDANNAAPAAAKSQTTLIVILVVLIVALLVVAGIFAFKLFSGNTTATSTTTSSASSSSAAATLDSAVWDDAKWDTTVAATVNGTEIPESKVVQYFKGLRETNSLTDDVSWANYLVEMNNYYAQYQGKTYSLSDLRSNILEGYIQWELVAQDAASKNVTVTDDAIDEKISSWKEQYGYTDDEDGWKSFLAQNGYYSEDDFRDYVKTSLLLDQLVSDQISALDVSADMDEVQNYADTYAQYYVGKQSSHILFDNEADAQTELTKLKAITDPDELATTFAADAASLSKDTTYEKDDTGNVGSDSVNKISDEYTAALDALSVGQLSDVVKDDNGYHIILCTGDFELPSSSSSSTSSTSTSASASTSAASTSGSTSATSASGSTSDTSASTSGTSASGSSSSSATTTHVDLDSLPSDVYDLFYNASYQSAYNTAAQQVYTDYVKSLEDAATIVINDMPADAPYVVDMSLATEQETSAVASSTSTSTSASASSATSTSASASASTGASASGSASGSASKSAASSSESASGSAKSSK